ncbi:MAG: protein-L-isoaspartate O-methyltransferase [Thermoplasmata archaeon]|nr:protein-L-isoaspartate O-methyltransferase [Thermoplasmata archaeon]
MSDTDRSGDAARMVADLAGILPSVAAAMRRVPRHQFVDASQSEVAYADEPLPLPGSGATISAPHMVALQLEWAELQPGQSVLEIGLGSGYLSALIAELVGPSGKVHGVEIDGRLARMARERLDRLGYSTRVDVHEGDGREGWKGGAPYDRVIVSCATPSILPAWIAQTTTSGTVVAPVGGTFSQTLVRYRRGPGGGVVERGPECRFVALKRRVPPHI